MPTMSKTPRGMGKLHRTSPTALWYFFCDGARVTTPYPSKAAAEVWRRKYLAKLASGELTGPEDATIGNLLDLVEQDYIAQGKKSIGALLSRLKRLRAEFGRLRAVDLTERAIELYRDSRDAKPATINRELEVLRRALTLGKRKRLLVAPPHVSMLRVDNVRTQRITHEQYRRLIKELRTPERWAAILAYHTGWRLGRVLDLRWSQVDFDEMVIHPPERQSEQKRVGTAPIYGGMVTALLECRKRAEWTRSEYVVHRSHGGKLVDIKKPWRAATKAAGLAGLRFHDLRACAASNLIDAGIPQVEAMAILGHQTPSMFQRYRIDSPKRLRDIGAQMEGFLRGEEKDGGRVN